MSYFKKPLGDVWWGSGTSGGQQQTTSQSPQQPSSYGTPATTPPPQPQKKEEAGVGSELAKIFGALAASKIASPAQPSAGSYIVPKAGISKTTMLIGGAIGVTALILLLKD